MTDAGGSREMVVPDNKTDPKEQPNSQAQTTQDEGPTPNSKPRVKRRVRGQEGKEREAAAVDSECENVGPWVPVRRVSLGSVKLEAEEKTEGEEVVLVVDEGEEETEEGAVGGSLALADPESPDLTTVPPYLTRSNQRILAAVDLQSIPVFSPRWSPSKPIPIQDDGILQPDFCRICHESDLEEPLLSPCRCKGSLSLVHRSCLERWLAEADSTTCELCGHIYRTERKPKYRVLPSVWAWLRSVDTRRERRELAFDLLACLAFTPLAVMGTYLGLLMAETLYNNETDDRDLSFSLYLDVEGRRVVLQTEEGVTERALEEVISNLPGRLATLSVISMMTTLDLAYASWVALRLQHHCGQWYSWYRRNCKVKLLTPSQTTSDSQQR